MVCEFWANFANGGKGMRILRIFLGGVGREHEFYELGEFYEFFLSLVVVCEFGANGNE